MRIVILDRAHDPDIGYPIYPDARPDLANDPVWAVVDVEDDGNEDWDMEYLAEGLTAAEAEAY
jgi:hypothetical protein